MLNFETYSTNKSLKSGNRVRNNLPKSTNCYRFEFKQVFTVFAELQWHCAQNKTERHASRYEPVQSLPQTKYNQ